MTEVRKLRRSRRNQVIGGVAGGLGEYFDTDPVLFRLGFVALFFLPVSGVLLYILMWIFLKEERPMLEESNSM